MKRFNKKLVYLFVGLLVALFAVYFLNDNDKVKNDAELPLPPVLERASSDLAGSLTTMEFWKFEEGEDYAIADTACGFGKDKVLGSTYEVNGQKLNVLPVFAFEDKKVSELMAKVRNTLGKRAVVLYYDAEAGLEDPDKGFMEFLSTFYNKPVLDANAEIPALRPLFIISPENDLIKFCQDPLPEGYQLQMPAGDNYWDMVYLPKVDLLNSALRKAYTMNLFDGSDKQLVYDGELEEEFQPGIYRVGIIAADLEEGDTALCFGQGCDESDESVIVEESNGSGVVQDSVGDTTDTGNRVPRFRVVNPGFRVVNPDFLRSNDNDVSDDNSSENQESTTSDDFGIGTQAFNFFRMNQNHGDRLIVLENPDVLDLVLRRQITELFHWQDVVNDHSGGFGLIEGHAVGLFGGHNTLLHFTAPASGVYSFDLKNFNFDQDSLGSDILSNLALGRDSDLYNIFSLYLMDTPKPVNSSKYTVPQKSLPNECDADGGKIGSVNAVICDRMNVFSIQEGPIEYMLEEGEEVYLNLNVDLSKLPNASVLDLSGYNIITTLKGFEVFMQTPDQLDYEFKYRSFEYYEGIRRGDYTIDPDPEFEDKRQCIDFETQQTVFCE